MLFDSPIYLLSLLLVTGIYWRLRRGAQNWFLLAFSYFFYGWWDWRFLGLIALSTVVDYFCALGIHGATGARRRKTLLALSLLLNFGFLGFFKYCDFFATSLHDALGALGIHTSVTTLRILLPPGISFYTFQAVAYMVDVYRGQLQPTRSLRDYALFISFFPHLIAGPIQRPDHLLPQVRQSRALDWSRMTDGALLIASGLFRKCVIADSAAILANAAFSGALAPDNGTATLIGMYAFAWQIYGDFSGYSNIARGSAQLLGFHFMVNFRQPYLAESLQAFWRRWHVSLSTWLRDYLYIPLGGSRRGEARTYLNLMTTMVLGGLWHGANWTFVVWGWIHGLGLAIERKIGAGQRGPASLAGRAIRILVTFHIVCLAWLFFRAPDLGAAYKALASLAVWRWTDSLARASLALAAVSVIAISIDIIENLRNEETCCQRAGPNARLVALAITVIATLLFAAPQTQAFIYFQF